MNTIERATNVISKKKKQIVRVLLTNRNSRNYSAVDEKHDELVGTSFSFSSNRDISKIVVITLRHFKLLSSINYR